MSIKMSRFPQSFSQFCHSSADTLPADGVSPHHMSFSSLDVHFNFPSFFRSFLYLSYAHIPFSAISTAMPHSNSLNPLV